MVEITLAVSVMLLIAWLTYVLSRLGVLECRVTELENRQGRPPQLP
jgi:hypothetical protein